MVELKEEDFEAAVARGAERLRQPRAVSAHFDAERNRVIIKLTTGIEVGFAPDDAESLRGATPEDLRTIEIQESGLGLHIPALDADLYVPALLEGWLGTKRWSTNAAAE